jgi:ferrous iron transport protein B
MMDIAEKKGISIDIEKLSLFLNVPIVSINPRENKGIETLDSEISKKIKDTEWKIKNGFIADDLIDHDLASEIIEVIPGISSYSAMHILINHESLELDKEVHEKLAYIEKKYTFNHTLFQAEDIKLRYRKIKDIVSKTVVNIDPNRNKLISEKLDDLFLHQQWGYVLMLVILFILFQAVFWLAEYPMNAIEWAFGEITQLASQNFPDNWFSNLLINGVIAGLGGILVFVPQIMILFAMITVLEDTGYMARISLLTDRMMRKFGLNGKSVMPMISGFACAVPAIMSARNIENRKERLLTILTTPLMSCSARIPVYTILISLVIPKTKIFGILSLQGMVMLGLYMLGFTFAMLLSAVFNYFIKISEKSFFILELPLYRPPRWGNVVLTMIQKAKIFVLDAGKVIMVISLVLWALSSFGPGDMRTVIEDKYDKKIIQRPELSKSYATEKKAELLEYSYAGIMGRAIEPVIRPLGFDWKIGIALITSFAAREVFVGTMATLYSVGEETDENNTTLRDKMNSAIRSDGKKVYTLATGVSLMIFYVFAMQCMSTLAVVKRETGSWKWPTLQFIYMTGLAYLLSMFAYWILS